MKCSACGSEEDVYADGICHKCKLAELEQNKKYFERKRAERGEQ